MLSFGDEEYWRDDEGDGQHNCEALDNINAWLESHTVEKFGPLTDLTPCATGNQVGMNATLYGGGFKHFNIEKFIEVIKSQDWRDPESVQLFTKADDDQMFVLSRLVDL